MNPELIVLGSGGRFIHPRRASSCYVLDDGAGRRLLVDAGGGAFEGFGIRALEAPSDPADPRATEMLTDGDGSSSPPTSPGSPSEHRSRAGAGRRVVSMP